jgi:hypothetical protein
MRHLLIALALTTLVGCGSEPPPITDGMTMAWSLSAEGQDQGLFRAAFTRVDGGWRLSSQTGSPGAMEPPTERLLDEHLRDDGEPFGLFTFPVWLPPGKRSENAGYEDMVVREVTDWLAWQAWHTRVGPAHGYYDVGTGFLVGFEVPRLGGLTAILTETNVPGLAVSGGSGR